MSAIAGILLLNGEPVQPGLLGAMTHRLSHRGPDGVHRWSAGSVGLAHCMRYTTPESLQERLPLRSRDGAACLTAHARLDNREELLGLLDVQAVVDLPTSAASIPDSALVLAAYRKWGEQCVTKLCGDFAFAIWDEAKQHFFCARDHMGVKPFYYYHDARCFVFASEIKAILALECVPRRLNEARLADYLLAQFQDTTSTLYQDIWRLPAAHTLCVSRKTLRTRRYWSLDPHYELSCRNDAEYAEAFRHCFAQAVAPRLRSAYAMGSTLSGGLDSSANVVMACNILNGGASELKKALHTFSAIYDQATSSDERLFIQTVLQHVSQGAFQVQGAFQQRSGNNGAASVQVASVPLVSHSVHPDRLSPLTEWSGASENDDEPLWNPQMALHWSLYESAQQSGVRALLDGYGGDDVVSNGVPYLRELASRGRWIQFLRTAHALAQNYDLSLQRIIWHEGIKAIAPGWTSAMWRTVRSHAMPRNAVHPPHEQAAFFDVPLRAEYARRIHLNERLAQRRVDAGANSHHSRKGRRSQRSIARSMHCQAMANGIYPFSMEINDRVAALFGIEERYPFFDKRLVEFCVALPSRQKLLGGWPRSILRRGLDGLLPAQVQWRNDKGDLTGSFHYGLQQKDRDVMRSIVFESPKSLGEFIDGEALRALYDRYFEGVPSDSDAYTLWRFATIALWLRRSGFCS
jgi:asparagine synthase (glutamine-hydrolysing)